MVYQIEHWWVLLVLQVFKLATRLHRNNVVLAFRLQIRANCSFIRNAYTYSPLFVLPSNVANRWLPCAIRRTVFALMLHLELIDVVLLVQFAH